MRARNTLMALSCLGLGCTSYNTDVPPLRAFGNEPFWNVTITVEGDVVYSRLGEPDISFLLEAPVEADSTVVYGPLKERTGRHEITVRIEDGDCQDTMADVVHPMRAHVVIDGEELSGCARFVEPTGSEQSP